MKVGCFTNFGNHEIWVFTAGSLRIPVWIILRLIVWVNYRENEAPDTSNAKPGISHDHKLLLKLVLHILQIPSGPLMNPKGSQRDFAGSSRNIFLLVRARRFVFVVCVWGSDSSKIHS